MFEDCVTVLVGLMLVTTVVFPLGVQTQPGASTGDVDGRACVGSEGCRQPTQRLGAQRLVVQQEGAPNDTSGPTQPGMTARVTDRNGSTFRVAVRNARYGASADVDPPSIADGPANLRGLTVVSQSFGSRLDLAVTVDRNLSAMSVPSTTGPPGEFDTPLLYSDLETTADTRDFDLTYEIGIDTATLRERNAEPSDVAVALYRDGRWQPVDIRRRVRAGDQLVIAVPSGGAGTLAVGLRHPEIRVTDITPEETPILANRTVPLAVSLENRGSSGGTETISLETDDRTLASRTVSVAAGSRRTVTVPVEFQQPGQRTVESGDYETQLTVTQPTPVISVSEIELADDRIRTGENGTVIAVVRNTGTADGMGVVRFTAFGDVVATKRIDIPRGQTRTVRFSQRFEAPGTYQIGVNNRSTTITVAGTPDWEPTPQDSGPEPTPTGSETGDRFGWTVPVLGAGIVLLCGVLTLGRLLLR